MLCEFVAPVELLGTEHAGELGLLDVQLHVGHEVMLVLEPAPADLALEARRLAALDPQVTIQAIQAHVEASAVRTLKAPVGVGQLLLRCQELVADIRLLLLLGMGRH